MKQKGKYHNNKGINSRRRYNNYTQLFTLIKEVTKCLKQILADLKGETDISQATVEEFNNPFTFMGRSYRQKIHRKTPSLNDTLAPKDCIYTCVCVYTHTHIYICSYSEINISTKRSGINTEVYMAQSLGKITQCHKHKVSANLRKQMISSIFSNHNAMRLEINYN